MYNRQNRNNRRKSTDSTLKNDINLSAHVYDGDRSRFPHMAFAIIQHLSLIETRESDESHRNKDALDAV